MHESKERPPTPEALSKFLGSPLRIPISLEKVFPTSRKSDSNIERVSELAKARTQEEVYDRALAGVVECLRTDLAHMSTQANRENIESQEESEYLHLKCAERLRVIDRHRPAHYDTTPTVQRIRASLNFTQWADGHKYDSISS
jgi:hypothetical protein